MHFNNLPATIIVHDIIVKATNPLALQGESEYYVHSKTACYNSFFVEF
jgi:hypothetical protein